MLPWGTCDSRVPKELFKDKASGRGKDNTSTGTRQTGRSLVFGGFAFLPFSLGPAGSLLWSLEALVFGGFAFPPVSLGPAGDCPCKD